MSSPKLRFSRAELCTRVMVDAVLMFTFLLSNWLCYVTPRTKTIYCTVFYMALAKEWRYGCGVAVRGAYHLFSISVRLTSDSTVANTYALSD